jgi:DNA repair protein RadC
MKPDDHITMHDMPDSERPRERLLQHGAGTLSNAELLAVVLGTGTRSENVLQLAGRVLAHFGGLHGLARLTATELQQVKGLGNARSAEILASLELGKRLYNQPAEERPRIESADDAARLVMDMSLLHQEQVRVILLDTNRRVVAIPTIYMGTVDMSIIRVSELFKDAIIRNSPAMILVHNHPSGDALPSPEDVELTRTVISAGKLLDIQLVDHVIIGQHSWKSLRNMKLAFRD